MYRLTNCWPHYYGAEQTGFGCKEQSRGRELSGRGLYYSNPTKDHLTKATGVLVLDMQGLADQLIRIRFDPERSERPGEACQFLL